MIVASLTGNIQAANNPTIITTVIANILPENNQSQAVWTVQANVSAVWTQQS